MKSLNGSIREGKERGYQREYLSSGMVVYGLLAQNHITDMLRQNKNLKTASNQAQNNH